VSICSVFDSSMWILDSSYTVFDSSVSSKWLNKDSSSSTKLKSCYSEEGWVNPVASIG